MTSKNWQFYTSIISLFIASISLLINIVFVILKNGKPIIHASLNDDNVYFRFYSTLEDSIDYFRRDGRGKLDFKDKDNSNGYRILNIVMSNTSDKPLTVQRIKLKDSKNNNILWVKYFSMKLYNINRKFSKNIIATSTNLNEFIETFSEIDLYDNDYIILNPYESKSLNLAISVEHVEVSVELITGNVRYPLIKKLNFLKKTPYKKPFKSYIIKTKGNNLMKQK